MSLKVFKVLLSWFFLVGLCLPVSFNAGSNPYLLINQTWALSSESIPLTSNIFVDIAKKQNPAVVNVSVRAKREKTRRQFNKPRSPQFPPGSPGQGDQFRDFYDKFFRQQPPGSKPKAPRGGGSGSGFIIDVDGHILTNNHVVEGADEIIVILDDDKEYTAKLIGTDPKTDIALIKITQEKDKNKPFPFLSMGNSDKLEVGEWVLAIGNPFGLSHTVTVGVVSAKNRSINAGPYDEFIQTDASINPGNSGGPLMNIKGEVIGINTAIISGPSGGGNVGIGFAIPVNVAKSILTDLRENGKVTRGWLGVMIQKISPELAKSFSLKDNKGALVGDVIPDGPAFKAGIKRGDVIVQFNEREVTSVEQLPKIVAQTNPETDVKVVVIRDGVPLTLNVRIAVLKEGEQKLARQGIAEDPLGLQGQDITPELAQSMGLETEEGVLVSDVIAGQGAAEAGIKRGDVITEIDRKPVKNMTEYSHSLGIIKKGRTVLFLIRRGGTTIYIAVKIK
jgi:serine protease Do